MKPQKPARPQTRIPGLHPLAALALAVAAGLALLAQSRLVVAQDAPAPESAGPEYKSATDKEQLEMLRRLLGVEAPRQEPAAAPPPPPAPEPTPAVQVETPEAPKVEPEPAKAKAPAKPAPKPVVKPKPAPKPKPVAKPKPAPKPAPKPKAPPKPAAKPAPEPQPVEEKAPEPALEEAATTPPAPEPEPAPEVAEGVPPPGTIIDAKNVDEWAAVLTPALRWVVQRGTKMEVVAPIPIPLDPPRAEATERYHAQVQLAPDGKSMLNHVAGLPFPGVTEEDPDAAIKIMFNFEQRLVIDDVDGRNFACVTGGLDSAQGVVPERHYRISHFRRLFHQGRLKVEPKPLWKTNENIRYREALGPITEPFDLKGAGFSYNRYLDAARQDDSWLYFPQQKRVRRLSTAQRSEGIFGQDVDLDSYAGFAGNPAWFDWQILGKKTVMLPLHAKNEPAKWSAKPVDFIFDDIWEPRETYIIAARSLLPGYNFSLRVIYVDAESWLIPITEVYDHSGQLWRAYFQQTKFGKKAMPYAKDAVYEDEQFFVQAISVFDLQQEHATFCEWPAPDAPADEELWYYYRGEDGSVPEDFDVAGFIQTGR